MSWHLAGETHQHTFVTASSAPVTVKSPFCHWACHSSAHHLHWEVHLNWNTKQSLESRGNMSISSPVSPEVEKLQAGNQIGSDLLLSEVGTEIECTWQAGEQWAEASLLLHFPEDRMLIYLDYSLSAFVSVLIPNPPKRQLQDLDLLGSWNRKKGSKIVVAKRQRKETACENRKKKGLRTGVRTSGETNSPPG